MKQLLAVFILLLFCVPPVQPQKSASQPTSPAGLDAGSAELVTLTNAWTDASNAKDRAKLEALMAPEFALYGWNGELWAPRSEWLDNLLNHMEIKEPWTMRELAPKVYGDFAIVTAVGTAAYTSDGHLFKLNVAVVDTWRRTNGRWQVVARNSCRISSTSASTTSPCTG
jgi:ketosteroid isomerase-like protein